MDKLSVKTENFCCLVTFYLHDIKLAIAHIFNLKTPKRHCPSQPKSPIKLYLCSEYYVYKEAISIFTCIESLGLHHHRWLVWTIIP